MTLKQYEALQALNCGLETETRLSLELPHERIRSFGNPQPAVRNSFLIPSEVSSPWPSFKENHVLKPGDLHHFESILYFHTLSMNDCE